MVSHRGPQDTESEDDINTLYITGGKDLLKFSVEKFHMFILHPLLFSLYPICLSAGVCIQLKR
jgi:hypothetical protein